MSNIKNQETFENVMVIPQLTISEQGTPMASSLNVAKVFGKEHKNILRDIENLLKDTPQDWGQLNFEHTLYIHPQNGETYPMYLLTRDAFTLLAMGFTGKKAVQFKIAYIEAFNAMEKTLMYRREKQADNKLAKFPDVEHPKLHHRYSFFGNVSEEQAKGIKGIMHFIALLYNTSYEIVEESSLKMFGLKTVESSNCVLASSLLGYLNTLHQIPNIYPCMDVNRLTLLKNAFYGLIDYWKMDNNILTDEYIANFIRNIGNIDALEDIQTESEYMRAIFIVYKAIMTEDHLKARIYEKK